MHAVIAVGGWHHLAIVSFDLEVRVSWVDVGDDEEDDDDMKMEVWLMSDFVLPEKMRSSWRVVVEASGRMYHSSSSGEHAPGWYACRHSGVHRPRGCCCCYCDTLYHHEHGEFHSEDAAVVVAMSPQDVVCTDFEGCFHAEGSEEEKARVPLMSV